MGENTATPTNTRITVAQVLIEIEYIKEKLNGLADYDERLKNVEKLTWAGASLVGLMAAIFVPIAIAAIKLWFGL